MSEFLSRIKSSRLWALLLFIALVVLNAMFDLNLEVSQDPNVSSPLIMVLWATLGFIGLNTIRGTGSGALIEQGVTAGANWLEKRLPKIGPDPEPDPVLPAEPTGTPTPGGVVEEPPLGS